MNNPFTQKWIVHFMKYESFISLCINHSFHYVLIIHFIKYCSNFAQIFSLCLKEIILLITSEFFAEVATEVRVHDI